MDAKSICGGPNSKVQFVKISDNSWSYTIPLACKNNSITSTITCNPSVTLTDFNSATCADKWSAQVTSTCGTFAVEGNDGMCTNDSPPFWPFTVASLVGCPDETTCCGCATDDDCVFRGGCFESDGSWTPGGGIDFWNECDARGGLSNTDTFFGYCCDGKCQEEPCDPTTGACCVCTDGWSNGYLGDTSFATEAERDQFQTYLAELIEFEKGVLEANGYECAEGYLVGTYLEISEIDGETFTRYATYGHSTTAKCCGVIDYEAEPANDGNNDSIYPCIQDEVTRNCVDGVSRDECEQCPSQTFHPGQACADAPC